MSELSMTYEKQEAGAVSRWLLNPFYYMAGGKALTVGVVVMLLTGGLAFLGKIRFDGLLDFHMGPPAPSLWINIAEVIVSWLLLSILLMVLGGILSKSRVRYIDVFGTQALARIPYFLTSLVALLPGAGRFAQKNLADPAVWRAFSFDMAIFLFLLLFGILMTIWMVMLMYRAFSVSCNVSGGSAKWLFATALIIGEILSVMIIRFGTQSLPVQAADLSSQATEFVSLLSKGKYETAEKMFDATMTSALPRKKLEEVWQSLPVQVGPFKSQGTMRKEKISGYDVFFVPCQFEKATLDAKIAFNGEGKISGFYFVPSSGE